MDDIFEAIFVDSGQHKTISKMGKLGILWQIDRRTGQFLNAADLGYQDIVKLDTGSGKVIYNPEKIPQPNAATSVNSSRWM
jgi:hypothetical protein